ncbi:hypothetical protein [Streptomyces sp. NPDC014894]|uniref:hypothetical protein n=1 Tax=Streptomyces sp. NPDC014894 TaxID=3364931 RepID=UPI0036FB2ECE
MIARGLLGGEFRPAASEQDLITVFEVPFESHLMESEIQPACHSELGAPLIVGLPEEFAESVLAGLTDESAGALPAGVLRIDRAGFDMAGSSANTFRDVGRLLRGVMSALCEGRDPEQTAREALRSW